MLLKLLTGRSVTSNVSGKQKHWSDPQVSSNMAASSKHYRSLRCGDEAHEGVARHTAAFANGARRGVLAILSACLLCMLVLLVLVDPVVRHCTGRDFMVDSISLYSRAVRHSARATTTSLLEVFQVYPPVLTVTPQGVLEITDGSSNASVDVVTGHGQTCQQVLAVHVFAFSYGQPFVGDYTPPACSFNRVTWNLTVTSAGRQFDRLGIVYLGDTEVWRTSTAEPTQNGIIWTYLKDMTAYLSLLKQQQKLIFDLGNLINDVYTGTFNITLTASYFTAEDSIIPADLIVPVSGHNASQNQASVFTVPPQAALNSLTLPRNIRKAVFSIAATGQSTEEFWWSNVLNTDVDTFPQYGELYGYSPFREVQLFIDGILVGVVWPFPVIFTGGVVPGLWRPIVGIDAFDLQEDEIDISPWLPLLCDGATHTFSIVVSGLNNTGNGAATLSEVTGDYWLVTGKVFVWLDQPGHVTTGTIPRNTQQSPSFEVSSSVGGLANGTNTTLNYQVNAQRSLYYDTTILTSRGRQQVYWKQMLSYSNTGNFSEGGFVTVNNQQTNGLALSSSGYARQFSYPLYAYQSYREMADNFTISANVNRGKHVKTKGRPVFPTGLESFAAAEGVQQEFSRFQGAQLDTTQVGSATFIENTTTSAAYSFGQTEQEMTFKGISIGRGGDSNRGSFPTIIGTRELFNRHVLAVNASIVYDDETLVNTPIGHTHGPPSSSNGGRGFVLSEVTDQGRRARGSHP